MKGISNEIVIDYYQIMKGEQPYLFETWVKSLGDKFEQHFYKTDEEIPKIGIKLSNSRQLLLYPDDVVIKGTMSGSTHYYIMDKEQFKEDFKRSNK